MNKPPLGRQLFEAVPPLEYAIPGLGKLKPVADEAQVIVEPVFPKNGWLLVLPHW